MSGAEMNQDQEIQNTQKITKAMEMVAASKMRRAQERMNQAYRMLKEPTSGPSGSGQS